MHRRIFTAISVIFLIGSSSQIVLAQPGGGCVTSKCHAQIGTKEWVHGPVGAGVCSVCHTLTDEKNHKFALTAEKEQLCFNCHETSRDMMLEDFVHTPVSDGNCTGCHDPHQTDYRFSLKGNASELCFNCHDKAKFDNEYVHGPIAVGDCNACHNPHASANEHQLNAPANEICFLCHKEQSDMMNKRHLHKPVEEKCTNCHNPHANNAKFLLPQDPPGLCLSCHEDLANYAQVSNPHQPVSNGQCQECHQAHSSDNPRLFPVPQTELCFSCHTELGDYVAKQSFKHGPVEQGDCNACHNPHGSEHYKILRKDFPKEFYTSYDEDKYAICFECHNADIAREQKTTTLTDFRNKDLNLHFLHVNKKEKGRSCRACHQVHASNQAKHVRTSVPFGNIDWELPVTFTKRENGGSCVVGCHAPKDYGRK